MSDNRRLSFALANLDPGDWKAFEGFASAFLAAEYPDLRVLAGTGDKGRDALFQSPGSGVVVQYSVQGKWKSKIRSTVGDLRKNSIPFSVLIFATNQRIGPSADDLKSDLRLEGTELDIRDESWFVARVEKSQETRTAARDLSSRVVDPLIPTAAAVRNSPLNDDHMKAGLLYLELVLQDSDGQRSHTKLAYESVVLGVLATTGSDARRTRLEIHEEVRLRFPGHQPLRLQNLVDGAIQRLNQKGRVTYKKGDDSFALHYAERIALVDQAARLAEERSSIRSEVSWVVAERATALELPVRPSESAEYVDAVEAVIEALLHQQGNRFAAAIESGSTILRRVDLVDLARGVIYPKAASLKTTISDGRANIQDLVELAADAVTQLLGHPGEAMQIHLRRLADSYTLLAFLQQTPDVQAAVSRLFSRGRLVLDTSAILPVFVETALAPEERQYTNLLHAARSAGMELFVTDGVINEIETHLARSVMCSGMVSRWRGDLPFVYQHWLANLNGTESFEAFVARFMGANPLVDLADFLSVHLGITRIDLGDLSRRLGLPTVGAVTEIWRERKQRRHANHMDEMNVDIRVNHDVEMYLGVLGMRTSEKPDIYGNEAWLVTIDGTAFRLPELAAAEGVQLPRSPAMHPNFLSNLLGIGPSRTMMQPSLKRLLPVAIDIHEHGWGIPALAEAATRVRQEHAGEAEYLIRRKLREAMDQLKASQRLFDQGDSTSPDDLIDLAESGVLTVDLQAASPAKVPQPPLP